MKKIITLQNFWQSGDFFIETNDRGALFFLSLHLPQRQTMGVSQRTFLWITIPNLFLVPAAYLIFIDMSVHSLSDDFVDDEDNFDSEEDVDLTQDGAKNDDALDEYAAVEEAELLLSDGSVLYANEFGNMLTILLAKITTKRKFKIQTLECKICIFQNKGINVN